MYVFNVVTQKTIEELHGLMNTTVSVSLMGILPSSSPRYCSFPTRSQHQHDDIPLMVVSKYGRVHVDLVRTDGSPCFMVLMKIVPPSL